MPGAASALVQPGSYRKPARIYQTTKWAGVLRPVALFMSC